MNPNELLEMLKEIKRCIGNGLIETNTSEQDFCYLQALTEAIRCVELLPELVEALEIYKRTVKAITMMPNYPSCIYKQKVYLRNYKEDCIEDSQMYKWCDDGLEALEILQDDLKFIELLKKAKGET